MMSALQDRIDSEAVDLPPFEGEVCPSCGIPTADHGGDLFGLEAECPDMQSSGLYVTTLGEWI